VTEAQTQMRRLDRDQALGEIAEVLAPFALDARAEILAHAATAFADGDRHHDQASTELLAAAGADLERARRIRAERGAGTNPLASIAAQTNRTAHAPNEDERLAARERARDTLTDMDAKWTGERWAELDREEPS
jgi:hypothetical protein